MRDRSVLGVIFSVTLLLLVIGSGLARAPRPTGPLPAAGLNADPTANAPWLNVEVDTPGNVGRHAAVAIHPYNGHTYISYYDATNQDLRMAHYVGSGGNCGPNNDWFCLTVDSAADVGKHSSIAIYPGTGDVAIAYHDATNGKLKCAFCWIPPTCVSWWQETVDKGIYPVSSTGLYTSLKWGWSSLSPVIAYHFNNTGGADALMVARFVGNGGNCGYAGDTVIGSWQCDTIQTGEGVGQYASLALDGDGNRHVAYYDGGNGDLWYATSRSGANCGPGNSWTCYPVTGATADAGRYASLYVDGGGHFHIAYYDATAGTLKYAVDVGAGGNCGVLGSAQCDEIDAMPTGSHPSGVSIAEDAAGYPIIAYQSEQGSLQVARPIAALGLPAGSGNCGPADPFSTWYCETINCYDPWVPARHGDFASIALNSAGLATIAYYGFITSADGNLMVSYQRFQVFLPLVMQNQ